MIPDVLVIGGGCAGLAAATALAERGARTEVLEARPRLGGRSYSWTDPATGDTEDNGQHLLMGCYEQFLAFARRTGAEDAIRFQDRLEVVLLEPGGREAVFRPAAALPPPLDVLWGLLRLEGFPVRDVAPARALVQRLRGGSPSGTVNEWLGANGQSAAARRVFWEPLALAVLNLDPARAPAALLAETLRRALLGGPRAARLGFPARGLDALVADPAARYLAARGGRVATGCRVASLEVDGHGRFAAARLRDGSRRAAGAAVLAVPHLAAASLLPPGASRFGAQEARALSSSPIVAVHLWLDREVADRPFAGLLDSSVHWVFDRAKVGGAKPPGYLALVTSAALGLAARPRETLAVEAFREIRRFLPRARDARVLRWRVLKERAATPGFEPRHLSMRPGSATRLPNLAIAGDWVDTGLPATLEGAAASGHAAAACLEATPSGAPSP